MFQTLTQILIDAGLAAVTPIRGSALAWAQSISLSRWDMISVAAADVAVGVKLTPVQVQVTDVLVRRTTTNVTVIIIAVLPASASGRVAPLFGCLALLLGAPQVASREVRAWLQRGKAPKRRDRIGQVRLELQQRTPEPKLSLCLLLGIVAAVLKHVPAV